MRYHAPMIFSRADSNYTSRCFSLSIPATILTRRSNKSNFSGTSTRAGAGAHAPVCCGLGLARDCLGDQLGHRLILNRAGPAATHLVVEPRDPIGEEAIAPFADRMGVDAKPRRHDGVAGLALARQQDLPPQCR